jgi:hypothetical protein
MNAMTRVLLAALVAASSAEAQGTLASRVDAVKNGRVRFTLTPREGVCGNGMSWFRKRDGSMSGTVINGNWSGGRDVEATCDRGPVRVVVVRKDGEIAEIRHYVGGTWKADTGITDLGQISAREAGNWLLQLAEFGPSKPARSAMSTATLVDSIDATVTLLRIAKNTERPSDVRSSAVNWLGETVGDEVAKTLDSIAYAPDDREVRKQAIYGISRRPADEAVPALLKMAETLPDRELRRTAIHWLVQSKDPRAIAWVEKQVAR